MSLRQLLSDEVLSALGRDPRLLPTDVVVYLHLFCHPPNTVYAHARQKGMSSETFRRSAKRLVQYGWADTIPSGRWPIVVASMPVDVESEIAKKLNLLREEVSYVGEWLMKCLLDLLVSDTDYGDNARPSWLVSGEGSGRFELDRWYRSAKVAFEFQGIQHFRAGNAFVTDENELRARIERDLRKAAICNTEGIRLIHVTASDLSFHRMRDKIEGLLPIAHLRESRPIYRALEKMCRSYINHASRDERW